MSIPMRAACGTCQIVGVKVDEDGCCATCGSAVVPVDAVNCVTFSSVECLRAKTYRKTIGALRTLADPVTLSVPLALLDAVANDQQYLYALAARAAKPKGGANG